MDYVLLLAFVIFASTALLFLPYTNMYRDIESAKAFNENLRNQLTVLEQEFPPKEKPGISARPSTYDTLTTVM